MAKPKEAKPEAGKKKSKPDISYEQPALRWQLGGLFAGVLVALIASTQPGKQVLHNYLLMPIYSDYLYVGSSVVAVDWSTTSVCTNR